MNFKKYAFINLNILPKKGLGGGGDGCGTRMVLNFRGVWHKNDLDVKYTPLLGGSRDKDCITIVFG